MTVISPFPCYRITIPFLDGWTYRKSVTLSRASGAVTDYQMKILVGESSGASGEDVDCAAHCASDFDDIRFTTSDGSTLLDYWIESISGATPNQLATIWVKFDSIGTSATTFYMYYGNAAAAAYRNGTNTFYLFEDFEWGANTNSLSTSGGNLTWTIVAGTLGISTSQKYGGTRSAMITPAGGSAQAYATSSGVDVNKSFRYRMYKENATDNFRVAQALASMTAAASWGADEKISYYKADGSGYTDTGETAAHSAWHLIEWNNFDEVAETADLWLDGLKIETGISIRTVSYPSANKVTIWSYIGAGYAWVDDIIVREWRATEPAWGVWGAEKTA